MNRRVGTIVLGNGTVFLGVGTIVLGNGTTHEANKVNISYPSRIVVEIVMRKGVQYMQSKRDTS